VSTRRGAPVHGVIPSRIICTHSVGWSRLNLPLTARLSADPKVILDGDNIEAAFRFALYQAVRGLFGMPT
jgi:hypothetical protein